MIIDGLKSAIREITEDMEACREAFENNRIDRNLMRQIKQADLDWGSGTKDSSM